MSRPETTAEIRPKPVGTQPRIDLDPGEHLLRSSPARYIEGVNSGTGRLYLTDGRLQWSASAHGRLAVEVEIPLETIAHVHAGWSHFMEIVPVLPDAIIVTDVDANLFHFTVFARRRWVSEIRTAVSGGP